LILLALLEALARFLRSRHLAGYNHPLGDPDGGLHIPVLANDVFHVKQALTGGVLYTPSLPAGTPFDLAPHLAVDTQMVGFGIDPPNLDHAKAPAVCHCGFLQLLPSTPFQPVTASQSPEPRGFLALFDPSHRERL
jgi:hypothetical protein